MDNNNTLLLIINFMCFEAEDIRILLILIDTCFFSIKTKLSRLYQENYIYPEICALFNENNFVFFFPCSNYNDNDDDQYVF